MGETIAFSICNKPFKPLSIPCGRVKSCESFPGMKPTNIYLALCYWQTKRFTQTHCSYIISNFNIIQASKHQSTHGWKIETTHALKSAKWTNTGSWGFNYSQKRCIPKFIGKQCDKNNQGLNNNKKKCNFLCRLCNVWLP